MKNFLLIIILIGVSLPLSGQRKSINRFICKYKNQKEATTISIPGWWIRTGGTFVKWAMDEEDFQEAETLIDLVGGVRGLRMMIVENPTSVNQSDVHELIRGLHKSKYEDYIMIKDGTSNISFMVKEKNSKIKGIILLIQDEENIIFMRLKTNILLDSFNKIEINPEDLNIMRA